MVLDDSRAGRALEEAEELHQRVDELEATVARLEARETSRQGIAARAKADTLLSLGWTCFRYTASALAMYGLWHGTAPTSARVAWGGLATLSAGAVFMRKSRSMARRMLYGFWVAGIMFFDYRRTRRRTDAMEKAGSMTAARQRRAPPRREGVSCCAF